MGSSSLLDIIGSITTFGLPLLCALRLNASASESSNAYYANYMLQTNMTTLTVMLENDLKQLGSYYTPTVTNPTAIVSAKSDEFSFWKGSELIAWKVGPPSELNSPSPGWTPNPYDCYLYRNVNGVVRRMNLGVTRMTFTYWNIADPTIVVTPPVPVSGFGNIGPIDVTIVLQSPYKMTQQYMNDTSQYEMYWRQIRSVARTTLVQIPN
jgi:hypothetical protein